ncbi:MAG: cupin domain-containing protein [bacterium]|nr:MAG: cupin domain-containing protein [bacterium]
MESRFSHLEVVDINPISDSWTTGDWMNIPLTQVNDSLVRLGVIKGEYHWHRHEAEDEFFIVIEGQLRVELEGRSFTLRPLQGITVPAGTVHRTLATEKTVILMVEKATTRPEGD